MQLFTFDLTGFKDDLIIVNNFERISSFENIFSEFSQKYPGTEEFKPLTMMSFYVNALFAGQSTYIYHFTNILIHIFVCFLVLMLLRRLEFSEIESFIGSMIFAVHPLIAGNVAWIAGRNYLLMAAMGLLALIFFIDYFQSRTTRKIWLSGLFALLSVLSDSTGFAVIVIMIAYSITMKREELKENFNTISAPLLSVVIVWFLMYMNVQSISKSVSSGHNQNVIMLAGVFFDFRYFQLIPQLTGEFLLPFKLSVLPAYNLIYTLIGLAALIAGLAYAKMKNLMSNDMLLGLTFFAVAVISGAISLSPQKTEFSDYSQGLSYFAVIGLIILIISLLSRSGMNYSSRVFSAGFVIVLGIFSFLSFYHAKSYESENSFFEAAYKSNPQNTNISNTLIETYLKKGDVDKAERMVRNSDLNDAEKAGNYIRLGDYYYTGKYYEKAVSYLEKAVSADTNNKNALNLLVNSHYSLRNYEKAESLLLPIVSDTSKYPDARWDLFNIYLESQDFSTADDFASKTFVSDDDKLRALQMVDGWSKIYFKQNDNVAVVKTMKVGLAIDSNNAVILNYLYDTYSKIGMKQKAAEYERRLKQIFIEQKLDK
ncbi:MAG: hypothetical protein RO257_12850 [Candidatus Kapabacteria bacterium]|nr:hypothetical protein [Candidatus Kapabacteria bacterium]